MFIFVAGLVGVGKSSIARRLAGRLAIHYYAIDAAKTHFGGYVIVWVRASEAIILERLKSKERKDHILTDPLKMYRSLAKEFESFDEGHIVCENNGSIEEATESLVSLIRNLASLGQ